MIKTAAKSEFRAEFFLSNTKAKIIKVVIIPALTVEGFHPVSPTYTQINSSANILLSLCFPIRERGNRRIIKIENKIATCNPLNARICARPAAFKFCFTSLPKNDLSPKRMEIKKFDVSRLSLEFSSLMIRFSFILTNLAFNDDEFPFFINPIPFHIAIIT